MNPNKESTCGGLRHPVLACLKRGWYALRPHHACWIELYLEAGMATGYSDINARSARQYFRAAMSAYVENQEYVSNPPECLADMESLVHLRDF